MSFSPGRGRVDTEKKDLIEPAAEQARPKKPYSQPQLTVLGTVEQMTQAVGTSGSDGLIGSTL